MRSRLRSRERPGHATQVGRSESEAHLRALAAAVTTVLATVTMPLSAANWESEVTVGTGVVFETNPRYESDEEKDSETGFDASIRGSITRRTPRGLVRISPSLRQTFYPDDGDGADSNRSLEHLDFDLPGNAQWQTPRMELGLSAGYSEIATRHSEFQAAVPDDPGEPPPPGGTQLVEIDEVQQRWNVGPNLAYSLSPADVVSVYASHTDISYEKETQPGYEFSGAGASIEHAFDEKNYISASVDGSTFESSSIPGAFPVDNETESYSATAGFRHELSETQSLGITAGAATSNFTVTEKALRPPGFLPCFDPGTGQFVPCRFKGSDSNFVGGLDYSLRSQVTTSTVSISRAIQPSSDGFTVTQDSFSASIVRTLSPRLRVSAGGYLIIQEIVGKGEAGGDLGTRLDRDYWRFELSANWNLTRKWSVTSLYRYTSNDEGEGSDAENNHEVRLGMRYRVLEYR